MTTTRRSILVAGLGHFAPQGSFPGGDGKNVELVEADMKKAADYGFDCTMLHLNPENEGDSLNEVREKLGNQKWDGFVFGFGLRGRKEYTALFEAVVNASREISPRTRMLFSTAPDGVFESIQRAFAM